MIGARHWHISDTLLEGPLHSCVIDDPYGIEVVLGQQLGGICEGFGLLEPPEHIMEFAQRHNGVTGNGRGYTARLFDFLPRDRRRLNKSIFTIQTK